MLASFRPTCACVSLALLIASVACAMPSASASAPPVHPDKVTDLPGLSFTPTFNHYSGYIPLPDSPTMMHYWFVESQGDPATDPVVLWLNGGPGCSSMMGMLTENGPFSIQSDGATIDLNPYAWNRYASFIYLESPSGVGFSYGTTNNYTSGDVTTARDNYNFLQAFFKEYSEFAKQRFYIAGESYAGNYILTLAQVIAEKNVDILAGRDPTDIFIDMRGIAVGNPTMDWVASQNAYLPFMSYHGVISIQDLNNVTAMCNGTFQPPPTQECSDKIAELTLQTYNINPYNVGDKCYGEGWGSTPGCFTMDALSALSRPTPFGSPSARAILSASVASPLSQTFVPCIDLKPIRTYLNTPAVMEALHINQDEVILPWDACSQVLNYGPIIHTMVPIYDYLLTNTNIRILIYSGDVDSCVPYLGTEEIVMTFPYVSRTPLKDPWQSWTYVADQVPNIKQVGGKFMQWDEKLAYATVRGAGHMVPHDRPEAGAALFYSFLNDPTEMNFRDIQVPTTPAAAPTRTPKIRLNE